VQQFDVKRRLGRTVNVGVVVLVSDERQPGTQPRDAEVRRNA
jgi:hypothetical protein